MFWFHQTISITRAMAKAVFWFHQTISITRAMARAVFWFHQTISVTRAMAVSVYLHRQSPFQPLHIRFPAKQRRYGIPQSLSTTLLQAVLTSYAALWPAASTGAHPAAGPPTTLSSHVPESRIIQILSTRYSYRKK